jgi:hypothetical protein
MRPSDVLPLHRETIRQLVTEAGMTNPRVFGSVARGEDNEESDLDILVDVKRATSLLTLVRVQDDLAKVTGVKVDLRTPGDLHPRLIEKVLTEAIVL